MLLNYRLQFYNALAAVNAIWRPGDPNLRPVFEELNRREAVAYVHLDVRFIFSHGGSVTAPLLTRAIERDNAAFCPGPFTACAVQFDRYVAKP